MKRYISLCGHLHHSYGHLGHGDLFGHVLPRLAMAIVFLTHKPLLNIHRGHVRKSVGPNSQKGLKQVQKCRV